MEPFTVHDSLSKGSWLDQVIIRTVKKTDLPALEWDGQYQHFRNLFADAYERSLQGRSVLWIAELPGTGLIGQVFVQLASDRSELADGHLRGYLYSFRVRESYRSSGLGSRLLLNAEGDLRRRGFRIVCLNVAKDNPRARQLYERKGYRIVANEPGIWSFKNDKGQWQQVEEPAWRMEKILY